MRFFASFIIVCFLLVNLVSCFSGNLDNIASMREEFAKYEGKTDVAYQCCENMFFNGYRFANYDIHSTPFLYEDHVYYFNSGKMVSKDSGHVVLYRCDHDGENVTKVYDTGWLECTSISGYFTTVPSFSLFYKYTQGEKEVFGQYFVDEGIFQSIDTAPTPFWQDKLEKHIVSVNEQAGVLTVYDAVDKTTKEASLENLLAEYIVSIEKYDFVYDSIDYCGGRYFIRYSTDLYYSELGQDDYYPILSFELDMNSMRLEFVGYFETLGCDNTIVLANPIRTH